MALDAGNAPAPPDAPSGGVAVPGLWRGAMRGSWRGAVARVEAAAFRPVDAASLIAFRVLFGVVMAAGIARFLASGWIERLYGEPTFFFKYPGFAWVEPWPVAWMYVHYAALGVLALLIAAGVWTRAAAAAFAIGFAYTQLVDVTNYLNHHYLVVLVAGLLAVLPISGRASVPAWMLWLVRLQVGVVYVYAAMAKAQGDWLVHAQPLNIWLTARIDTPVIGPWLDERVVAYAMSWAGFLYDATIVAWLSWRRTRIPAYVVLCGFHLATGYFFNIGMFPFIMTAAATIFFAPSWPRRLLRRPAPPLAAAEPVRWTPARRLVAGLVIAHVAIQVLAPLRHRAYPGDVLWNEDGMRFAWQVMVREKHGSVTFIVRFPDGRRLEVPPRRYLTWRQEREMAGQPDLILQLARHIAAELRAAGHGDVAVHADTAVSLNGRAPIPLIDPEVDLARVRDVGPRWWVRPAPTEPPKHLRPRQRQ